MGVWSGGFVALVVLAFSIIGGLFVTNAVQATRECNLNTDCSELTYCGSDFKCHEYPSQVIYKTDYTIPALILGVGLVISALVLKHGGW